MFKALQPFSDPFEFYHASGELNQLREGFRNDMRKAESELPVRQTSAGRIYQFQNQAWCRRVSGVYSNQVAREAPDLAHALLVERKDGNFFWLVSAPQFQNRKVQKNYALNFPEGVEPQQQESTIWLRKRLIDFLMPLIFNLLFN